MGSFCSRCFTHFPLLCNEWLEGIFEACSLLRGITFIYDVNCRQQQFEQSPAGKAARAQIAAAAKQSANPNRGEPVLKVSIRNLDSVA